MRIHICGIYGSGKSTLANILSKEFKIKNYELDDLKYKVKFSKIRLVRERISLLKKICAGKNWIVEGPWSDYALVSFKKADIVIIMKTSRLVCSYRILKRHFSRNKLEKDSLKTNLKLIKSVFKYYHSKEPVSFYAHKELIKKLNKNYIIIKKKSQIPGVIDLVKMVQNDLIKVKRIKK